MRKLEQRFLTAAVICTMAVSAVSGCSQGKRKAEPEPSQPPGKQQHTEASDLIQSETGEDEPEEETVHEEGAEILQNEGTAEDEALMRSAFSSSLPFTEGDDKVCAIAYLGNSGAVQEENLKLFFERFCPNMTEQQLRAIRTIDYGGSQCYLIIPRYQDSRFAMNCLEQEDNGSFKISRTDVVTEPVFILYCNPAQYANAEVNITYMDRTYVMMPRLNDGEERMEAMQVALDLTEEIRKEN